MRRRIDRKLRGGTLGLALTSVIGLSLVFAPGASAQDPGQVGSWSSLQNYPVTPVSMGVTPDGKIVAWDQANAQPNFGPVPNSGPAMVLDPATGNITRSVNVAPRTTFCSLIASLPDGRIAIIGGGVDSAAGATTEVQIYDGDSKTFSVAGQMNYKRWYPGGTLDRDGNPIIAGGTNRGIERINQLTGASSMLESTFPTNWYPDLVRTSDGRFVIEDVGDNATQGPGRYLLSGSTLSNISNTQNLQTRRRGVRTMIGPYTMFYNSGGTSTDSMIVDASGSSPTYTRAANSRFPHMTGQAVTLPTGDVLAVGGNSSGDDTKGTPVMTPELYSTATNTWTSMADIARRRTYHSVAALLPDGRIWSAGSSFDEVQEPNGQFFSPPYLFRKDGTGQAAPRPTATDAPASVAAGQSFSIATNNPSNIAYASFIRLAGTTHQVNAGQAYVKLNTTATSGRVSMTAPSIDQAPPGYYMVFLVDSQGVPSIAPIVRFDKTAGAAPQPRVTLSSQAGSQTRAWNAFDGDATQSAFAQTSPSNQPFWQVDLGASRDIGNLDITLRSDANTERDLWVFTSDTPFNSTTVSGAQSQAGVTEYRLQTPSGHTGTVPVNTSARYIRVQDPGTSTDLTLAEVQVQNPASNQNPSVSLTSPANGASFTAPASLSYAADAADSDGTVAKVEFFRGTTLVGTDTTSPYTASETGVGAGSYTLKARATDDDGAVVDSSTRTVTVTSTGAGSPTVSLTSPADGANFNPPASISYSANASDPGGKVTRVEFFRGTTLVGRDNKSPYSASESGVGNGTYTLKARATDNTGNVVDSATRTITVGTASNQNPSVSLTSPANGATFTAPASISYAATASDSDGTVTKVEFYRGTNLVATDTSSPYTASESGVAAGSYTLKARATDSGGAVVDSATRTVTVSAPSNQSPTVNVTSPANGATFTAPATYTFSANAADADGSVTKVEFFRGSTLVATDTTSPFSVTDSGVGAGSYALTAKATDSGGATTTSSPVNITVNGGAGGPVAAYAFDDGAGATLADETNHGHDGSISGATWDNAGHSGRALSFDGVDDMVTIADDAALDFTSAFTIESWIKPRTLNGYRMVILKEAPPSSLAYGLYAGSGGGPRPSGWTESGSAVGPNDIPTGSWTHLAMTYSGGTINLYVNGSLAASAPAFAPPVTGGLLRIGGNSIWDFETFDGLIDDVRLYNRALSPAEIVADRDTPVPTGP